MSRFDVVLKQLMDQPKKHSFLPWIPSTANPGVTDIQGVEFFTAGGVPMQPPTYTKLIILMPDSPLDLDLFPVEDPKELELEHETLFELEGWRIENYSKQSHHEFYWITHICGVTKWRQQIDQWMIVADGVCGECCEVIPDEVMAVWKLKNMDLMPSEATAEQVLNDGREFGQ